MSPFEFTFALSAVILGLALTHMAANVHKLLLAGRRVKWAIEPVLLAGIVLLIIVFVWMDQWGLRGEASFSVGQMLFQVLKLLTLYFGAASCLPEIEPGSERIDLFAYYDRTRWLSFGALIASLLLFTAYRLLFNDELARLTVARGFVILLYPSLYALLIFLRGRWLNILMLGGILAFYAWVVVGQRISL